MLNQVFTPKQRANTMDDTFTRYIFLLTWIKQKQKFNTNVIANIELQLLQFGGDVIEMVCQTWNAQ